MSAGFDPYHTWLGIAPEEQPPNHYRLLGIRLLESDPVVIENAADRQMAHLRTFQTGPRSALSQLLLNEVAAAKVCLLNPAKKAAYDRTLLAAAGPVVEAEGGPRAAKWSRSGLRTALVGMAIAAIVIAGAVAVGLRGTLPREDSPVAGQVAPAPPPRQPVPEEPASEAGTAPTEKPLPETAPPEKPPPSTPSPEPREGPPDHQEPAAVPGEPAETPSEPEVSPTAPETPPSGEEPPPATSPEPGSEPGEVGLPARRAIPSVSQCEPIVRDLEKRYQPLKERTAEEQIALARELMTSSETVAGVEEYVLLGTARDLARQGGDVGLMLDAISRLGAGFEIEEMAEKEAALGSLATAVTSAPQIEAAVLEINELIEEAVSREHYDVAVRLAEHACLAAKHPAGAPFRKGATDRRESLRKLAEQYEQVRRAMATLESRPEDAPANGLVAQWYCLERGNWSRGLPYLARSDDEKLRPLAQLEQSAPPAEPMEQVALADRWWDAGEERKSPARERVEARAVFWYQAAVDRLSGAVKARVEKRLEDHAQRVAAQIGPPGKMSLACREKRFRAELLAKYGGTAQSERAVAAALAWIAAQQWPDGGWSFARNPNRNAQGQQDPGTEVHPRNAATGLALMAFLGSGQTHTSGQYQDNVQAGLVFLGGRMKSSRTGGSFHEQNTSMCSHALATTALCEAYAMTRDSRLKLPAREAIRYICNTQEPQGGWRLQQGGSRNTTIFGWELGALRAGYLGGVPVPSAAPRLAMGYLDQVQSANGSRYGYSQAEPNNPTMTAVGLLCRLQLGWPRNHPALVQGVEWLGQAGPDTDNFYQDYYTTQLMFNVGGQAWEHWNSSMRDVLLGTQVASGDEAGSWYAANETSNRPGGRLYCTILATLILQTYYRYPPLEAK